MLRVVCPAASAAIAALDTAAAPDAGVKALFDKHQLLGTFAWDCSKPAARNNWYYVHRALDATHVQRDQMSGPQTRDFAIIFERGSELRPNEISPSGTRDGQAIDVVHRVEDNRMRAMQATAGGRPEVVDGRTMIGQTVPWLSKCGP